MKPKTCRVCKKKFQPTRAMQPVCADIECMVSYGKQAAEKKKAKNLAQQGRQMRKQIRERKEKLKSRADYQREAQSAVNAFVRELEKELPCISCGRFHQGQYHAGHYLSRGAHPELALDPRNIHKQCAPCNTHLSGNQINYRKGLIERYGVEYVEFLEGPHEPKKYTIDELKAIRDLYRKQLKDLRA